MMEYNILLVEDDPKDEMLILRALQKNGIANAVMVARDGAEALDCLFGTGTHPDRNSGKLPAVVMLDLNLPKIDGLEVLKRIRENERTKFLPIVILTSSNEERDRIEGYKLGANSYVRKPVEFTAFINAVREVGLYWVMLNETMPLTGGGASPHGT